MTIDRRHFVLGSLAGGLAAACGSGREPTAAATATLRPAADPLAPPPPAAAKKTILVLGGTGFIGPHIVTAAVARGHTVTLFNRGKTHPGLFPGVEKLHGDRDGQLGALANRRWDAVIDPSGFVPRIVKLSAELLAPSVGHYVFISTISVYARLDALNPDESVPVETIADPTNEDTKANYGALKALCEQAAEAAMPGRVANIRPGLIIGPGDPSGRFTHWPTRLAAGGEVLAPGDGTTPVQYIDGRDLGSWLIRVV
jgi:2'-hydroxyisoflavone reductase